MKVRLFLNSQRIILFLSTFFLLSLYPTYAQRPPQGDGKAIKDKLQEVLDKTATLGSNLEALCDLNCQSTPAGRRFGQKAARIKQAHERAKNAHGRAKDSDFQEIVRQRPKKKDDGCDPQIQVCIQAQGTTITASTDPEFDDERGKDVVEDLGELSSDVDELNALLAGNIPPAPPTPDVKLENAEYFFPSSMRPSSEVAFAAFIANLAAEKAAAIADHFCDQTAVALGFGGNGSAACSVIEGVHQVLDGIYQMLDYIGQDATSAEVTGAYKRTKNIFDQLVIADGNVDNIKAVVEALGKKILQLEENQKIIIQLLSMPQGQRPAFPKPATP